MTLVRVKTLAPKISSCERRARVTGEFSEVLCMLEGLTQAFFDIFFEAFDILDYICSPSPKAKEEEGPSPSRW